MSRFGTIDFIGGGQLAPAGGSSDSGALLPILITGPLTFSTTTEAGTLVAYLGNIPSGVTPTLSPNDGRLVIAGSTGAWLVAKGLSAADEGDIALTVSAAGANATTAKVTVTKGTVVVTPPTDPEPPVPSGARNTARPQLSGTFAPDQVITAVAGTWTGSTGGQTRRIARDGVLMSPLVSQFVFQASDYGALFEVVETDTNSGTIARSVARIAAPDNSIYSEDFNQPDGTLLTDIPGWEVYHPFYDDFTPHDYDAPGTPPENALYGRPEKAVYGGNLCTIVDGGTAIYGVGAAFGYDLGESNIDVEYTFHATYADPANANFFNTGRNIALWPGRQNNRIAISTSRYGLEIGQSYAYNPAYPSGEEQNVFTFYDLRATVFANRVEPKSWQDGDKLRFRVSEGYIQAFVNGTRIDDSTINGGLGLSVSRVTPCNILPAPGGLSSANAGVPLPVPAWKSIKVSRITAKTVAIGSAVASNPTATAGAGKLALSGSVSGGVSALKYAFTNRDGEAFGPFADLPTVFSGSSWTANLSNIPAALEGGNTTIIVRDAADASVFATATRSFPLYQARAPFEKGMNEGYMDGYIPSITHRDVWQRLDWRSFKAVQQVSIVLQPGARNSDPSYTTAAELGMGYDGVIHRYNPNETTKQILAALPNAMSAGDYTVTFPPTCPPDFQNLVNITVLSPPNNGSATIRVAATADNRTAGNMIFTGPIPASGLTGSILKVGDPTPNLLVSDELVAHYIRIKAKRIRHMTQSQINFDANVRSTIDQIWTGWVNGAPVTMAFMVELSNRTNANLWLNISHRHSKAVRRELMRQAKVGLNANLSVTIEPSNEVWNDAFDQAAYAQGEGVRAGYYNALGDAGAFTGVFHNWNEFGGLNFQKWNLNTVANGGGYPLVPVNAGERVMVSQYGLGVFCWEAKVNIPANNPAYHILQNGNQSGDNEYWKLIADGGQINLARQRWYAQWSREVFMDAEEIFADQPQRLVKALGGWALGAAAYQMPIVDWNNGALAKTIDEWVVAPYWGDALGLLEYERSYTAPNGATFGPAEKALVATNMPAFLDALFAVTPYAIKDTMGRLRDAKHALARHCFERWGVPINKVQIGSYEANHALVMSGAWPNMAKAAEAYPLILKDQRFGRDTADFISQLDEIGGCHMLFDRMSGPEGSGFDPNYFLRQNWAFAWGEKDITAENYRFTAMADYVPIAGG